MITNYDSSTSHTAHFAPATGSADGMINAKLETSQSTCNIKRICGSMVMVEYRVA